MSVDLNDQNFHDSNSPSSPPIIPSSPQQEFRPHKHQQTPAYDRFLRQVYHDKLNHDKLNGKFIMHFCHFGLLVSYVLLHPGQKCVQYGVNITAGSLPPPHESDHGPNDWTPYAGQVEFELADFLYRQNQSLHLKLMLCSIYRMPQQLHMMDQHHFRITSTCTILLMLLLLVTFHGRASLFNTMEIIQKMKFHLGWKQTMMSGSVILANLFMILF